MEILETVIKVSVLFIPEVSTLVYRRSKCKHNQGCASIIFILFYTEYKDELFSGLSLAY